MPDVADKRVGHFLARHAPAARARRDPDEGCARSPSSTSRPPASIRRPPPNCSTSSATSSTEGVSVLLSSHLLERVQSVCDRVALFNAGHIVLMGTVAELGRQVLGGGFVVEVEAEGQGLADAAGARPGRQQVESAAANAAPAARRPRRAAGSGGRGGRRRAGALLRLSRRGAEPRGDLHPVLPGAARSKEERHAA